MRSRLGLAGSASRCDEDEDNGRTEIALDIDLNPEPEQRADTEQEQPDALALSDFVITPHAKSQIEVQPDTGRRDAVAKH